MTRCLVMLAVCATVTPRAGAALIATIEDGPAIFSLNDDGTADFRPDGTIDCLKRVGEWYTVAGIQENPQPLANQGAPTVTGSGTNALRIEYSLVGDLVLTQTVSLQNFGVGASVTLAYEITNVGATSRDVSLFSYGDWDLNPNPGDDSVQAIATANTLELDFEDAPTGLVETVANEADAFYIGSDETLFNTFSAGAIPTSALPGSAITGADVEGAFEWIRSIPSGQTVIVSGSVNVFHIPSPATMAFLAPSLLFMMRRHRD